MSRCLPWNSRSAQLLKNNVSIKLFAFLLIFGFSFLFWSKYPRDQLLSEYPIYDEDITEEAIQNVAINPKYAEIYRKKSYLPKDLKYLLLWTPDDFAPFYYLGKGQRAFIKHNCSMTNCYVTSNRNFFGGNLTKFHAIGFNGRNIGGYTKRDLPQVRSPHQKYIYFNMESAVNFPVCNNIFNNYFNWTATYKLKSDILYSYIAIHDKNGTIVGPKQNMKWVETMDKIDEDLAERLQNKSKAAAWFVSNCDTKSKREQYVKKLQQSLEVFGLSLDIYGSCGKLKCPQYRHSDCQALLEKDYYFYMAMENSLDEDYVTEKLLTAVQHNTVPIVFGGANYSWFLPPGSYLNALEYTPAQLAGLMDRLIRSPKSYQKFFKWKKYYTYDKKEISCDTCDALNDRTKLENTSIYVDFKRWWNAPNLGCG